MYLVKLYREFVIWRKIRSIAIENKELLSDNGFRVDWIGRIYTVINLPEEVANHNPQIQQGYVLMKLRDYDRLFLSLGIADYIVPEFEKIESSDSYLLILSPDRDYIRIVPFIYFLFRLFVMIILFRIGFNISMKYSSTMLDLFHKIKDLII